MQPQDQQYPQQPDQPGYAPMPDPQQQMATGYPPQVQPGMAPEQQYAQPDPQMMQRPIAGYAQPYQVPSVQYPQQPDQPGYAPMPDPQQQMATGYPPQVQPGMAPEQQYAQPDPQMMQQPIAGYAQPAPAPVAAVPSYVPDEAMAATNKNQAPQTPAPRPNNTTQNTLLFSEIRDNMIIMADGSFRAVVACKSINFDLMSSREREGIEFSYQNFINSLTHPIQILIRSQKVDIGPYLERLLKIRKNQDNMLLGVLMDDYIEFIEILSEEANIMDKSFYVVIPFSPTGDLSNIKDAGKGFFAKLFGSTAGTAKVTKIDKLTYQKAKDEVKNRVDSVSSGLFQMGVHCTQLTTKQLGELYYSYYNPDTAVREPLRNFENNTLTYVRQGDGEANRPSLGGGVG